MVMLKNLMCHKWGLLALILFATFSIRFLGIFHDLPYSYYPDEEHFVKRSVAFGSGDFNPHWFSKPAFFMYVLFFEYSLMFVIGYIGGIFNTVEEFAIFYINNPGNFYFLGRLSSMLFGTGIVYLTYLLGKENFNKNIGLIAALFISLSFAHYESSIQIKADIPATFFTLLSLLYLCRSLGDNKFLNLGKSGFWGGVGMATKYYSLALIVPYLVASILRKRSEGISKYNGFIVLAIPMMAFVIGFFLCSPYNFLDPSWFNIYVFPHIQNLFGTIGENLEDLRGVKYKPGEMFFPSCYQYLLTIIDNRGMGLGIGLTSLMGVVIGLKKCSN